jgi:hypothetical protein
MEWYSPDPMNLAKLNIPASLETKKLVRGTCKGIPEGRLDGIALALGFPHKQTLLNCSILELLKSQTFLYE